MRFSSTPALRRLAIGMTAVIATTLTCALADHVHHLAFTHTWWFNTIYWAAAPAWLATLAAFGYQFLADLDRRSRRRAFAPIDLLDLTIKDNALKTAQYRISGIETDAEQIAAADQIYRWITDPAADRRVREAAHRNLHNRITHNTKITVAEFIDRAAEYERFLTTTEEVMTR